jgi:cytochrome c biogenesis protein CcdA
MNTVMILLIYALHITISINIILFTISIFKNLNDKLKKIEKYFYYISLVLLISIILIFNL